MTNLPEATKVCSAFWALQDTFEELPAFYGMYPDTTLAPAFSRSRRAVDGRRHLPNTTLSLEQERHRTVAGLLGPVVTSGEGGTPIQAFAPSRLDTCSVPFRALSPSTARNRVTQGAKMELCHEGARTPTDCYSRAGALARLSSQVYTTTSATASKCSTSSCPRPGNGASRRRGRSSLDVVMAAFRG